MLPVLVLHIIGRRETLFCHICIWQVISSVYFYSVYTVFITVFITDTLSKNVGVQTEFVLAEFVLFGN